MTSENGKPPYYDLESHDREVTEEEIKGLKDF